MEKSGTSGVAGPSGSSSGPAVGVLATDGVSVAGGRRVGGGWWNGGWRGVVTREGQNGDDQAEDHNACDPSDDVQYAGLYVRGTPMVPTR